jgi:hypothetical protein
MHYFTVSTDFHFTPACFDASPRHLQGMHQCFSAARLVVVSSFALFAQPAYQQKKTLVHSLKMTW